MGFVSIYWDSFLGIPLGWLDAYLNFDVYTGWKVTAWKIFFTIVLLIIVFEVYLRIKAFLRKRKMRLETQEAVAAAAGTEIKEDSFTKQLEGVKNPEQTIATLKKAKKYDKLGEVLAALNRNKEAARAFAKAGDKKRAAMEWAKAGQTLKAARMLERAGDHGTAARFYGEKGKHLKAAKAYRKLGDLPKTGAAYGEAGKYADAGSAFGDYFRTTGDDGAVQAEAAELCYKLLEKEEARAAIPQDECKVLMLAVAERLESTQQAERAASLFRACGDPARAGQIYLRGGKLELAAQCMKEAGRNKEANEIGGQYYESIGRWKEAGMAYEGAESFTKAGDCWSKANEAQRAAQCYERGGEFFGAGFALVHVRDWESAIPLFQRVPEDHKNHGESRAMLGRCFYQLKDYAHCAAALDNHLTGERVTQDNIDYFWMLSLAYEQLGDLTKSRELLQKIRTVNVEYRDVSQRLSSIKQRESMLEASGDSALKATPAPPSGQPTAVMDMVANQLGARYTLLSELGRGGMGVVYMAEDTQLDRKVALKFLGSLVDDNDEFKQRFVREAKAAAKVSHPNIVSIYDIGTQEGQAYIAMEFIEGPNLHKYLHRKGHLEPREAANIVAQACAALDAVHQCGVVHRDIKPDNIVIAKGGLVKVMDFGLAKSEGLRLTASGVVMGTPCYMAPEQVKGQDVDLRADLYALGLVLHELLTGKTVFEDGDVLKRQVEEIPPPPGHVVEGISSELDNLVLKSISKNPDERFQTAAEMQQALRKIGK